MQRRLVTVLLAPLLACALLLHIGVACRAPLDAAVPLPTGTALDASTPATAATPADAAPRAGGDARPEAARAAVPPRTGRTGPVTLEAYRVVTTLAARTGQSPVPTVVPRFDGKACGSVSRSGRGNQSTDRRDPGPQAVSALPDATVRRDNTADGRPADADAGPDPVRLSVLRC
ncbi:hypothetical protein [Micromonospora sp. NPDC057141]|uniref:hypothetical protein n=1 Tax=Micromonospora sp. NPDC057141 TaxID=3346033 RepID=UPI003636796C